MEKTMSAILSTSAIYKLKGKLPPTTQEIVQYYNKKRDKMTRSEIRKEYKMLVEAEKYRGIVCQHAWKAWKRLPIRAKAWVSVDAMINQGMSIVYRYPTGGWSVNYDPN